ncbi:cobalt ECF transporter T component CbiQ [Aphanothece hegewaldii CCALA 016]|uniref:Cobalt ECF transporter T component CbiQ n=1 Tax=Aphanothece hegewaldii CCALA 016 TaxID=2107694 RepID=A0A2T1LYS6_9CHRO|nr:cobalt ECF transporter T component CbiQ [Aphanothece hegewaldii]PSF37521.1 cobalt ECF transporter T component CbiQ [Aphanothece hegewaldii CCALA 016]
MLLHIGAFKLDVDSKRFTLWHQLAPRTRVFCAFLFVFANALTPNGQWLTWAIYGFGLVILILLSQVTLLVLLRRVAVEFTFIGTVLLGTLFREGGTVLWSWGWLQITTAGLNVLGSVALKSFLSLLMLNILILTTSIPSLLHALAALRVPPLLVAILSSMYRYIAVLIDEFDSMRRAALSRNLMASKQWQRLVVGNMIGSLFIRTYERGDRIHQAMLARGYTGLLPVTQVEQVGKIDYLSIVLTFIIILLGQFIYLR